MVQAIPGVLLTCDIPLKEFLLALNEQQEPTKRFVISDLGEQHLFVKEKDLEFIQEKVRDWQQIFHFEPKDKQPGH